MRIAFFETLIVKFSTEDMQELLRLVRSISNNVNQIAVRVNSTDKVYDEDMKNIQDGDCVYFVHSFYAARCDDYVIATAEYGAELTAAVANGNVYGCQFHPEKSGKVGLEILKAFIGLKEETGC